MNTFENFANKESFLPRNVFLSQCLERGGKRLADKEIGFAKNAVKHP